MNPALEQYRIFRALSLAYTNQLRMMDWRYKISAHNCYKEAQRNMAIARRAAQVQAPWAFQIGGAK